MSILHEAYLQHIVQDFFRGTPTNDLMEKSDDPLLNEVRRYIQKYYATIHSIIYTGTLHKLQREPLPSFDMLYAKDFTFRVFVNICVDNYQTIGAFLLDLLRDYHDHRTNVVRKSRTVEIFNDKRSMTPLGVLKHLRCIKDGGECAEFRILVPEEPDQQLANMVLIGGQSGMKNVSKGHFGQTLAEYKVNMGNNHKIRKALQAVVLKDNAQAENFADHSLTKFGFAYLKYKAMQMQQLLAHLVQVQTNVHAAATEQEKIKVIEKEMNDSYSLLSHLLGIVSRLRSQPVQQPQQALSVAAELQEVTENIEKLTRTYATLQQLLREIKDRPAAPSVVAPPLTDAVMLEKIQELEAEVARLKSGGGGSASAVESDALKAMSTDVKDKFLRFKKRGFPPKTIILGMIQDGVSPEDIRLIKEELKIEEEIEIPKVTIPSPADFLTALSSSDVDTIVQPENVVLPDLNLILQNDQSVVAGFEQSAGGSPTFFIQGRTGNAVPPFRENVDGEKIEKVDMSLTRLESVGLIFKTYAHIIEALLRKDINYLRDPLHKERFANVIANALYYASKDVAMRIRDMLKNKDDDRDENLKKFKKLLVKPVSDADPSLLYEKWIDTTFLSKLLAQPRAEEAEKEARKCIQMIVAVGDILKIEGIVLVYQKLYRQFMKQSMFEFVMNQLLPTKPQNMFTTTIGSDLAATAASHILEKTTLKLYDKFVSSKVDEEGAKNLIKASLQNESRSGNLENTVQLMTASGAFTEQQKSDVQETLNFIKDFAKKAFGFMGTSKNGKIEEKVDDFVRLLLLFITLFLESCKKRDDVKRSITADKLRMLSNSGISKFGRSHLKRCHKLRKRSRGRHALRL